MLTVICIMILAFVILGKDINSLLKRVKNVDWRDRIDRLRNRISPYALKVGRTATRPLLQFYYVMNDEATSVLDKVLIYAAIIYTVSPISLLPAAVYHLLGILDEGVAMAYVYKKVKDKITPEINAMVDETLDEWFGVEYEIV